MKAIKIQRLRPQTANHEGGERTLSTVAPNPNLPAPKHSQEQQTLEGCRWWWELGGYTPSSPCQHGLGLGCSFPVPLMEWMLTRGNARKGGAEPSRAKPMAGASVSPFSLWRLASVVLLAKSWRLQLLSLLLERLCCPLWKKSGWKSKSPARHDVKTKSWHSTSTSELKFKEKLGINYFSYFNVTSKGSFVQVCLSPRDSPKSRVCLTSVGSQSHVNFWLDKDICGLMTTMSWEQIFTGPSFSMPDAQKVERKWEDLISSIQLTWKDTNPILQCVHCRKYQRFTEDSQQSYP